MGVRDTISKTTVEGTQDKNEHLIGQKRGERSP